MQNVRYNQRPHTLICTFLNMRALGNLHIKCTLPAGTPARATSGAQPPHRWRSWSSQWRRAWWQECHSLKWQTNGKATENTIQTIHCMRCVKTSQDAVLFDTCFKTSKRKLKFKLNTLVFMDSSYEHSSLTYQRLSSQKQDRTGSTGRPCF